MSDEFDSNDEDRLDPAQLRDALKQRQAAPVKKAEAEDGDVPSILPIEIDVTDMRGKRWSGRVIFRVPNLGMQIEIGNLKAAMMPSGPPRDGDLSALTVEMMSYLEVCLDKKERPSWWKPHRFYDNTVLSFVYARARAHHARFLGAEEVGGDDAEAGGDRPADDDLDAVERDLQPAAERRETLVSHTDGGTRAGQRARGSRADQG